MVYIWYTNIPVLLFYIPVKLTNIKIKNIKATSSMQWIPDGNNLYLRVDKSGNKTWWYRFTMNGKRNWYSIGSLLTISLKDARIQAIETKSIVDKGIDPRYYTDPSMINNVYLKDVALEYLEQTQQSGKSDTHKRQVKSLINNHILPYFKNILIRDVTRKQCLAFLKEFEKRGGWSKETRQKQY